jgi:cation transport protein ChaC
MWSVHYRGTPENRGLVLALDEIRDTYCDGVAFKVKADNANMVLDYLRERELISDAYLEIETDIQLRSGEVVNAYTYIVNRDHDQYAKDLSLDAQAKIISTAVGSVGPNTEYLFNVADHLRELGIEDAQLEDLSKKTRALI